MRECDSSNHHVSVVVVVVVVVVVDVNFFSFSTSRELLHGYSSKFVRMFPWWTPTKFVQIFCGIMGNFVQFLVHSSSLKPLTRNHSYLIWRVPKGPSFYFVQIMSL